MRGESVRQGQVAQSPEKTQAFMLKVGAPSYGILRGNVVVA